MFIQTDLQDPGKSVNARNIKTKQACITITFDHSSDDYLDYPQSWCTYCIPMMDLMAEIPAHWAAQMKTYTAISGAHRGKPLMFSQRYCVLPCHLSKTDESFLQMVPRR
jgi:hypothetical protein